ncbi:acetyltransferase, partial [Escherichia coli]
MLCLKYPEPEEVSQGHPAGSVFVLPPQGQPGASSATRDNLERLR